MGFVKKAQLNHMVIYLLNRLRYICERTQEPGIYLKKGIFSAAFNR